MFALGSKLLGWVGLVSGLATVVAGAASVIGEKAASVAGMISLILAALGGSVARPTNQRRGD